MNSSKISTSDALLWIQTLTTCLRTAQAPQSLLTLLSNIKKMQSLVPIAIRIVQRGMK
jgi:hypothetical protein